MPDRAVVVTFDDGYADNLHNAKSLLERQDVPATVFVTTGYLGSRREFWWDELDRLLLQPGTLPHTIRLTLDGRSYAWELGEAAQYSQDAYHRHRSWNVSLQEDPGTRQRLYRSLCQLFRRLPEEARSKALDELRTCVDARPAGRPTHRALSSEEVLQLAEGGLLEVGSHSVTHPVLSTLPAPAQRAEIHESKAQLESILGHPVTSFAYPYGSPADYTEETVAIVRHGGFACACANFPNVVRRGADPFQLPRILVRNWDGEEFARRLDGWFRG
jgi:peptidoglycan/xylan/chitin deacetylase (PgdA/CDA1 family)